MYIQELSPTRLRGRMVVLDVVMITGGQVVAYGIGAAFENLHGGWRWMVGLGAVPAGLQFVMLFFLPESRTYRAFLHTFVRLNVFFSSYPHPARRDGQGKVCHVADIRSCHPHPSLTQGMPNSASSAYSPPHTP